jgi:hypothetical protein
MRRFSAYPLASALLALSLAACTPYSVHTTARPLAVGERSTSMVFSVVPGGIADDSSRTSLAVPSIDLERRFGLDDRSDVGLRINSLSGAIVSYKRRLDGPTSAPTAATALLIGAGFVNWGQHAHVEATLIRSGAERASIVPYGGLRIIQIAPLTSVAPHDAPTIGAFGGTRLGSRDGGVTIEVGAFYDRSALKMRRGDFVIVPSISWHGRSRRRAARP